MLKPIHLYNKCKHCLTITDWSEDDNYFKYTMGYGCELFDDMKVLGDTPCDLTDYMLCPNKTKDDKK